VLLRAVKFVMRAATLASDPAADTSIFSTGCSEQARK
jgi:hypothetical protein